MLLNLFARSSGEMLSSSLGTRMRRILLWGLFTACYLLAFAYHLGVWQAGEPAGGGLAFAYQLVLLAGFAVLWVLVSHYYRQRRAAPGKVFWTILLIGVLILLLARGLMSIGSAPTMEPIGSAPAMDLRSATDTRGFDVETGIPLTLPTVLKMNILSLLEVVFCFILLLRFRELVLYKRTKRSERNWYLMLAFMLAASLFTFMKSPRTEIGGLEVVAIVPAVILMVINAMRLSWIVYLSFKEKMIVIGLSLLLLTLLLGGLTLGDDSLLPGASTFLRHYSYPLQLFTTLSVVFGILYCTTAFLSLLFHLPTTSDFQRKAGEVAAMHSLTHLISQVFDPEQLAATIAASPVEAGAGQAAWLAVPDPNSGSLRPHLVAAHNITPARVAELVDLEALYLEAVTRQEPLLLAEAPADHRIDVRPGDGLGSLLIVPLMARDEPLGALYVARDVTHGFETDDIEAISVFAAQAALALDNARLFEERVEKERLTRELTIAREVQLKLLPQRLPTLEGVSLAASSVSALEVGGDYYDFADLGDGRMAIIIADVSGKGTSAAFYMAELQGIFHALSPLVPSPIDFLTQANRALATSLEKHVFISVIYGLIDLQKEEFLLARAGHCPAATIRLDGEARLIRTQGMGLGLDRSGLFRRTLVEERIRLQPGDVFALYTDGVVESRSAEGEEYGYERLLDVLRENRHEEAPELHHALLADLNQFIGEEDAYDDDLTLVVLKWRGIELPHLMASAGVLSGRETLVSEGGEENEPNSRKPR